MTARQNILLMAGGTGGHVFPALAVAQEFKARGFAVHFLGTPRGIENELIEPAGYRLHHIHIGGLRGKNLATLLKAPVQLLRALLQARALIKQLRPLCVVGFGGYVTGPGGLAAWLCRAPLFIHEQNAVAGTSNRLLARFAQRIFLGFPRVLGFAATALGKSEVIGNPLRAELFAIAPRPLQAGQTAQLLVLGGSLGAEPINQLLPAALALLPEALRPQVVHQAGRAHVEKTVQRYQEAKVSAEVLPFIRDMASAYARADVVICRCGALTVSELAAAGKASLLLPLPQAIDDHQTHNARYLSDAGAAVRLVQKDIDAAALSAQLADLLKHPEKLNVMATQAKQLAMPGAAKALAETCLGRAHATH